MHNRIYQETNDLQEEKCHTHACMCNEIGPRPRYLAGYRAHVSSSAVLRLYSFLLKGCFEAWGVAAQVGLFQWEEEKPQGIGSMALREILNREHKEDRSNTPGQDYVEINISRYSDNDLFSASRAHSMSLTSLTYASCNCSFFSSNFLWLLLSLQCVHSIHTLGRGLVIRLLVVPHI